jgi:anti-sigma regulatory factor (Ser/Thr protein kinase)
MICKASSYCFEYVLRPMAKGKRFGVVCYTIIWLLLSSFSKTFSQHLAHKQYTVKDGLPGAVVYQCVQDKDGFMWFATNQGVSRFDGRVFRNFSKEDGLPDNDVIKLYLDRFNNIWFATLSGIPAFYSNGRIRSLNCKGVYAIAEDMITDSIILIANYFSNDVRYTGYYSTVNTGGEWQLQAQFREAPMLNSLYNQLLLRGSAPSGALFYYSMVSDNSCAVTIKTTADQKSFVFKSNNNRLFLPYAMYSFLSVLPAKKAIVFYSTDSVYFSDMRGLRPLFSMKDAGLDLKYDINSIFFENDSTLWMCTRNKGLIKVSNCMSDNRVFRYFFPESFCSSIFKDHEQGYWVTTLNDGVYYLPNLDFYKLPSGSESGGGDVKCIETCADGSLMGGFADGSIIKINTRSFDAKPFASWSATHKNNRVMDMHPLPGNSIIVAGDHGLYKLSGQTNIKRISEWLAIKDVLFVADTLMVLTGAQGVGLFNIHRNGVRLIFPSRAMCIVALKGHYFWGTLTGVYEYDGHGTVALGKKHPALAGITNRINIAPDSSLWFSTQDGLVILRNGTSHVITKSTGLLSNTCKHVLFDGNIAWVATDRGISRIDYKWTGEKLDYSVSAITEDDGLVSNDVNQTALVGEWLWAATARGISFFARNYIATATFRPLVNINRVLAGSKELPVTDTINIDHRDNNLAIELSTISYRSGKNTVCEYRLSNGDSTWHRITNNVINFPSLPFGEYALEMRAIDRWGVKTDPWRRLVIVNTPPFWRTVKFEIIIYVTSILLMAAVFYGYSRSRQQKKEKEYFVTKKMRDLEMMALRAQMNPHFIFNCLSSIQYFILRSDALNANLYLHKFSTLIRKILQQSNAAAILLSDEIAILTLYLELEKMRLDDRLEYTVSVEENIRTNEIYLPSMVIQPYIENAIKHGASPLRSRQGQVNVHFMMHGNYLQCSVEDNGEGISVSHKQNETLPGEYASMGNSITAKRIDTINSINKEKILLQITDRRQTDPAACGTLVELYFPIQTD